MDKNIFFFEEQILIDKRKQLNDFETDGNNNIPLQHFKDVVEEYERLLAKSQRIQSVSQKMIDGVEELKLKLLYKVNIDELTGLYNRRYMIESLERYFKDALRSQKPLTAMLIDIDNFNEYNRYYGIENGDACLQTISTAIKESVVRPSDFVSRCGGEEFFILLPYVDKNGALIVANRILNNIRALEIESSVKGKNVSVSIGVTSAYVMFGMSSRPEDMLKTTTDAVYLSKMNGKDRVTFLEM